MKNNGAVERKVILRWGAFSSAPKLIAQIGSRAIVLSGKDTVRRLGILDALLTGLEKHGCESISFGGINSEPRADIVDEAALQAMKEECDVVVGLGGGSVLDAAKAVAAIARTGNSSWDLTSWGRSEAGAPIQLAKTLPLVCIPTLTGTGSEANGKGVLYNPVLQEKAVFFDDHLLPCLAVVDPSLTVTVDAIRTWTGALDIVAHGIEDYLTQTTTDVAYGQRCFRLANITLEMARRAARNPHHRHARTVLARKAMDVWDGSFNGPETPWTLHALAHVVGARLQISHSFAVSRLLPAWIAFIRDRHPERVVGFHLDTRDMSPLPALPIKTIVCDYDALAQEAIRIYGDNGIMPGWPGLTQTDVVNILEQALLK